MPKKTKDDKETEEGKVNEENKQEYDHHGRRNRLRAKFMITGFEGFSDHEVVEMLLYYCIKQKNVKPLAKKILKEYGCLHSLLEATPEELKVRLKLSDATVIMLGLLIPLARACAHSKNRDIKIFKSFNELSEYVSSLFIGQPMECFYVLCFNEKMHLIHTELASKGTFNRVELYTNNIAILIASYKVKYVVISHNHPSGDPKISEEDIHATCRLVNMLENMDVEVLDHIIVANEIVSLAKLKKCSLRGIEGMSEKASRISNTNKTVQDDLDDFSTTLRTRPQ